MHRDAPEQKEAKEKAEQQRMGTGPKEKRVIPSVTNERGEWRQCNEGKYDFVLDDINHPGEVVFELFAPKHLPTTSIDVDVHPTYG